MTVNDRNSVHLLCSCVFFVSRATRRNVPEPSRDETSRPCRIRAPTLPQSGHPWDRTTGAVGRRGGPLGLPYSALSVHPAFGPVQMVTWSKSRILVTPQRLMVFTSRFQVEGSAPAQPHRDIQRHALLGRCRRGTATLAGLCGQTGILLSADSVRPEGYWSVRPFGFVRSPDGRTMGG